MSSSYGEIIMSKSLLYITAHRHSCQIDCSVGWFQLLQRRFCDTTTPRRETTRHASESDASRSRVGGWCGGFANKTYRETHNRKGNN